MLSTLAVAKQIKGPCTFLQCQRYNWVPIPLNNPSFWKFRKPGHVAVNLMMMPHYTGVFGTWPMAMVSANRERVVVEGPICKSSKIMGWFSKDVGKDTVASAAESGDVTTNGSSESTASSSSSSSLKIPKMNVPRFAFNSSILWDPERWGRPTTVPDTSQDSIKFLQELVLEDETKLKGIPPDCSQIMLWQLHISSANPLPSNQSENGR